MAHLVREAVVDPSASSTLSTTATPSTEPLANTTDRSADLSRCDQYSPRLTWLQSNNETGTGLSADVLSDGLILLTI